MTCNILGRMAYDKLNSDGLCSMISYVIHIFKIEASKILHSNYSKQLYTHYSTREGPQGDLTSGLPARTDGRQLPPEHSNRSLTEGRPLSFE